MNPIIFILLCFAALGLFDKMFKNRLGLATSFDRGIITMGDFMMSVGGFYCIAIAFLNGHATLFENKEMIISSLLAPDLGGYSIIESMTHADNILIFCGVLLTSTLGCLISFQLPIFFNLNFTNATLINEALRIVFQMSIIVCGSLVFCEIVLRKFSNQIERVGQILNIDKYSVMGIILSFGTSIAMLPLFSKMNKKGKIINAAFSLSGAFVFGGQLGFIASVNPASVTWFVVVKLVAGILGLVIANVMEE